MKQRKFTISMRVVLMIFALLPFSASAENVTVEQALQKVGEFKKKHCIKGMRRVESVQTSLTHVLLPSDMLLDGEEPFYIFNGANSFYIVSSESDYGDVLAYSDEGQFDVNNIAPSAKYLLDSYKQQIELVKISKAPVAKTVSFSSSKLLTTANLGQNGSFWWNACPKINGSYCYAGCGPTAMAIVMRYYKWPKSGEGSNSVTVNGTKYTVDFSAQNYSWSDIPNESPYDVTWSQTAKDEAAKILYHCGVAANSEYGTSGTSTIITNIGTVMMNHFKYKVSLNKKYGMYYWELRSSYTDDAWAQLIKSEIDANRPCIMSGGDHIFVCDGYDTSGKFHFNLGWAGTSNGYYSMSSVANHDVDLAILGITPDTSKGYTPDDNTGDDTGDTSTSIDGHDYVDLGLPSGKLWATMNYGATAPEKYGTYITWSNISKVTTNWGDKWRTPTQAEAKELVTKCTWTQTTKNNVNGYTVKGPNGNSIFIPCGGIQISGFSLETGSSIYTWTSSSSSDALAYTLYAADGTAQYNMCCKTSVTYAPVRPISTLTSSEVSKYEKKTATCSFALSSYTMKVGETYTQTATTNSDGAITYSSSNTSVATVNSSTGVVTALKEGSVTITANVASTDNYEAASATYSITVDAIELPTIDGHEYIDLGLPSGTLWSTCNVGASIPGEYGDYFAWGETKRQISNEYSWASYIWSDGGISDSIPNLTKYCQQSNYGYNGFTDSLAELTADDDAATVNWGSNWQMPSSAQWHELIDSNNTTIIWSTQNGLKGLLVTSNASGYTDKSIFLPATGYRLNGTITHGGSGGDFWARDQIDADANTARYLGFYYTNIKWYEDGSPRCVGRNVRAVCTFTSSDISKTEKKTATCSFVESSCTIKVGKTYIQIANTNSDGAITYMSNNTSVATVDASTGEVTALKEGHATITAKVASTDNYVATSASYGITVEALPNPADHDYVDLGLPSGTLWATCNIGANSPEEYGDFYSWGEIEVKSTYDWDPYKWNKRKNGNLYMTKYCTDSSSGDVDNKTTLELEDDVANVLCGGDWRMPTRADFKELFDNTTCVYTSQNGINGILMTANNGNTIFFPGSGYKDFGRPASNTTCNGNCLYWTSSLYTNENIKAYCALLGWIGDYSLFSTEYRCDAIPIRPVFINEALNVRGVNTTSPAVPVGTYSVDGTKIAEPHKGINIIRMSDGTTRKVLYK